MENLREDGEHEEVNRKLLADQKAFEEEQKEFERRAPEIEKKESRKERFITWGVIILVSLGILFLGFALLN